MANTLYYTIFKTKPGWIGILASKDGLRAVTLPQKTEHQAVDSLGEQAKQAIFSPQNFVDLTRRFQEYYSGKRTVFLNKLDCSNATAFQRQVWETTRLIPYGETRSYGWIAKQIGKPKEVRAIGQALGKNPFLIIVPCHRVIASDGSLGGFGGGLETKQTLLEMEKVASS
jgi:methylated-DNA-[protein]-cysteine S-methyltransferase